MIWVYVSLYFIHNLIISRRRWIWTVLLFCLLWRWIGRLGRIPILRCISSRWSVPWVRLSCAPWWRWCWWIIVRLLTWLGRWNTRIVWLTSLRWHWRSSRIICYYTWLDYHILVDCAWLRWIESRWRSIIRGWLVERSTAESNENKDNPVKYIFSAISYFTYTVQAIYHDRTMYLSLFWWL